ncbi:MAG TPA: molybdopterin cofactor-binding domain-containing protein [Ktedonobacteraceae bacterium]
MELELNINGVIKSLDVAPQESLVTVLRREGYTSVKQGCETGECGACTVLVDGMARPGCVTLAAQAGGCTLTTVESLAHQSPNGARKLHALQEAFIDTGAIQCGFCTPGMLLSALALLKHNSSPDAEEVRETLSGNLCRCSGYARPVQAVLRAAALMRGETVTPLSRPVAHESAQMWESALSAAEMLPGNALGQQLVLARNSTLVETLSANGLSSVGQAERKVDGVRLASGQPAFVNDLELRDMLYARILTSPHAHAIIREIDTSEARALSGVHAVLTYKDVQRAAYTSAGQPWPEPGPHDQYALDNRVRFVGDRVAVVAAETLEIAEQALALIRVDYELLPAVFEPRLAISAQAPRIHPEPESYGIHDPDHNLAAYVSAEVGDVEAGFAQADLVVENEYIVPPVQQVPLERHSAITYWDENDRLVVRSSTQAPAHLRRILASLLGLPPRRIRVVRPGAGDSFGAQQDVLVEDLCAFLTLATKRPVHLEYTRAEEFRSHTRHAQIIHMKTGVRGDGKIIANSMVLLANAGAYGAHALSTQSNTGAQTLPLYPAAHLRFEASVVYTNLPPAGAFTGYGAPQGFFALESQMDEIARRLNMDPLELRRRNWIKAGDEIQLAYQLNPGQKGERQIIQSSGLAECLRLVEEKLQWQAKRGKGREGRFRRGVGVAISMHGQEPAAQGVAGASLKLNEDGSFNLLVATRGFETEIAQIVAETLGVGVEDILLQAEDTDITPFASSTSAAATISNSGGAARQAAEQVRAQLLEVAGQMLKFKPEQLTIQGQVISTQDGQSVTVSQVALHSLYIEHPRQIAAMASWTGRQAPAFAAQGAEVEVDTETGVVRVTRAISAVDVGRAINPLLIESQIEGNATQALGYSISEELLYDQRGQLLTSNLSDYRIFSAPDMPVLETYLVESNDPAGPFGAKASAEIATDGMMPAVANAVADALGVRLRQVPLTPERVLRALRSQAQSG